MSMNRYPLWKNLLVIGVLLIAFLYALPNLYGTDPAVQISAADTAALPDAQTRELIQSTLQKANLSPKSTEAQARSLLLRFTSTDDQFRAKELLSQTLGSNWLVALNLAPATPHWLEAINAKPMRLGLDLRGGLHFLLQVDVDSVTGAQTSGNLANIGQALRKEKVRYANLARGDANSIVVQFHTNEALEAGRRVLGDQFPHFIWAPEKNAPTHSLVALKGVLAPSALQQSRQETIEQAMSTLRNRVNELGVSEATVQQQGASRIAIDLPGIQDTAQAENILGKTATLEFRLVEDTGTSNTIAPVGSTAYPFGNGLIFLKDQIVLRGSSITSASANVSEDGRPAVSVRLGGLGDTNFSRATAENIGRRMAIVYVEVKSKVNEVNGKKEIHYTTQRRVISAPVIQSALANSFEITGLTSHEEARTLALLLRAGALPAPVTLIESREVGPNLGKQNIQMGVLSVEVGFILVVLFMALYYRGMGLIADLALLANLVLIVAILSLLGATLTLPGIAGIVLTMGMAVDANVLIFERIREELRNGAGIQASIYAGYDRAFMTIVDANISTLIVAIVLFSLGSGTIKNFAVTLTIGLITSMFTAITGTRAIVNLLYGRKSVKKISIGI